MHTASYIIKLKFPLKMFLSTQSHALLTSRKTAQNAFPLSKLDSTPSTNSDKAKEMEWSSLKLNWELLRHYFEKKNCTGDYRLLFQLFYLN